MEPLRVRSSLRPSDDPEVVLRAGFAVNVHLAVEPHHGDALVAWLDRVLEAAPLPPTVALVGMSAEDTKPFTKTTLSGCRRQLKRAGRDAFFWIGGDTDGDNPPFVVGATLEEEGEGLSCLRVRLPLDWTASVDDPVATLQRWFAGLPIVVGWAGPSLFHGPGEQLSDHLGAARPTLRRELAAQRGWVPDDDSGPALEGSRVPHVAWLTLLGETLASQARLEGLDVRHDGGVAWIRAGDPTPEGGPALADVAHALEPLLDLAPRRAAAAWFEGDTWGEEEAAAWLRRWLVDETTWAGLAPKLAGDA